MSVDDQEQEDDGAGIEGEIRRGRAYSLAEAVGRAGAGNLKGASPVPASQQSLLEIGRLLESRLADPEGSLTRTLLTRLSDDLPLLARHTGRPEGALAELLDRTLESPASLTELVRETDARWGRDLDERPRFEPAGRPPAADDPYTLGGVRTLLTALRQGL